MIDEIRKYRGSKEYYFVFAQLITAARYRGTLTYQEVAKMMGLPQRGSYMGKEIGRLIGLISEDEVKNGRPMLSAIVIGVSGEPGEGFYNWAEELKNVKLETKEAKRRFWEQEMVEVYETWRMDLNDDNQ